MISKCSLHYQSTNMLSSTRSKDCPHWYKTGDHLGEICSVEIQASRSEKQGRFYRLPTKADLEGAHKATLELKKRGGGDGLEPSARLVEAPCSACVSYAGVYAV